MEANQVLNADFNDLVFEGRNKDYGAYDLRRKYDKHLTRAVIVAISLLVLALLSPYIIAYFTPEPPPPPPIETTRITELTAAPPLDATKPPPPPPSIPQPEIKQIKFVPPKVVKEEVTEEPPKQDELKQAPVGQTNIDGDKIDYTPPPKDIEVIKTPPKTEIYEIVDEYPSFPGGYDVWLAKNIEYPADALEMGIEGTVYLKVVIDETGRISNVDVMKGVAGLTDEAVRKVKNMPSWEPGKMAGHKVKTRMVIPVKFKINR